MPKHSHQLKEIIGSKATGSGWAGVNFSTGDGKMENFAFGDGGRFPKTEDSGLGQPHNNMPPYLVVNFIIKYK